MGAKIQCTNGQCKTAFHVTCAMLHELTAFKEFEMEQWMLKTDGNGETDQPGYELVRYVKPELLCARHNPVRLKGFGVSIGGVGLTRLSLLRLLSICGRSKKIHYGRIGFDICRLDIPSNCDGRRGTDLSPSSSVLSKVWMM